MSSYFSIVIPTKNRSSLLYLSIKSIKNQSFTDYELIVIDNDDGDDTKKICELTNLYGTTSYLRTGGLSMVDNWNTALSQAKGRWIMLLEDKQMLYPSALQKLYDCLENNDIQTTLNFNSDWYNDLGKNGLGYVKKNKYTGSLTQKTSKDILHEYEESLIKLNKPFKYLNYFPLPQNSVVSSKILQQTKEKFGSFCSFGAPDFTSAMKKLLLTENVYHLDEPMTLVSTMRQSNGLASAINREEAHKRDIVNAGENYKKELQNLKFNELSTYNVFLIDYMTITNKKLTVDDDVYVTMIFKDIYNRYALQNKVNIKKSIQKINAEINKIQNKKHLIIARIISHKFKTLSYIKMNNIKNILKILLNIKIKKYKSPLDYFNEINK